MKYGVMMFGLNPIFLRDKEDFLRRIAADGYDSLEPCLSLHPIEALADRVWTPEDLAENQPLLEKYKIAISSVHFFTAGIAGELDALIPVLKQYSIPQVVIHCPSFATKSEYEQVVPGISAVGQALLREGIELLLHNGTGDSSVRIDGVSGYEWLVRACGGAVFAQPDTGWLISGGVDPVDFLTRNREFVRSLHYKDMEKTETGLSETGIGTGLVDVPACARFARENGLIQIADQDGSKGDFMEDVARVAKLLISLE